jgi:hypothetical protein
MNTIELQQFLELKNFAMKQTSSITAVLEKSPIFIFIDEKANACVANYSHKDKTVIYAHANPIKILLYLISQKLNVIVFEDTLLASLEEAINNVLTSYNVKLEEKNGSNIQNKISRDGSPKS